MLLYSIVHYRCRKSVRFTSILPASFPSIVGIVVVPLEPSSTRSHRVRKGCCFRYCHVQVFKNAVNRDAKPFERLMGGAHHLRHSGDVLVTQKAEKRSSVH